MYYILFYKTVENYIERRAAFRDAHLALARNSNEKGDLLLAGALADPADGAVLVFRGDGPEVAEDFARQDPYVLNGLIVEWKIRPWTVVIGADPEPVEVFAGTAWEAGFVKSLLENEEIEAFLMDEIVGTLTPWYTAPGGAGAVRVVVSSLDQSRARQVVDGFERNRNQDSGAASDPE
jgi:uncharacterized protein YciI